jgi:hypothetical protein
MKIIELIPKINHHQHQNSHHTSTEFKSTNSLYRQIAWMYAAISVSLKLNEKIVTIQKLL